MKTMRIDEIKETLKRSQLLTRGSMMGEGAAGKDRTGMGSVEVVQEEEDIEEVVKELENQVINNDDEALPEQDEEDEDDANGLNDEENGEEDDEDDDGMDNGLEEIDPQVLKL